MPCVRELFSRAKMFGMPLRGEIDYSVDIDLDLADVQPSVAGPKKATGSDQSCLNLGKHFAELLEKPVRDGGYGKTEMSIFAKNIVVELNGSAPRERRDVFNRQQGRPGN